MMLRPLALAAALCALTQTSVADEASREAIRKSLAELAPNSKLGTIEPSAIPGMFEVTVDSSAVLYVSGDGRYIMQGVLFDAKEKKNLTDARQTGLRKDLMASVPVKDRIVFTPKDGKVKYRVAVFTDVDCGFCRKLHHEMADYNARGIEIQYLSWPRAGQGSDTWRKHVANLNFMADGRIRVRQARGASDYCRTTGRSIHNAASAATPSREVTHKAAAPTPSISSPNSSGAKACATRAGAIIRPWRSP